MNEIVLVKLGGSLITDKGRVRTVRRAALARLADEIAAAVRPGDRTLVVGHGSGSFGHVAAASAGVHEGLTGAGQLAGISRTQSDAATLHRSVVDSFQGAGLSPFSIAPSSALVTRGRRPVNVTVEPLVRALEAGLLPLTYGDVVMDWSQGVGICSTETVLLAFARRLLRRGFKIGRALWFGDTAGVYDGSGATIEQIGSSDRAMLRDIVGGARTTDVTGGMRHRLDAALALARLGVPSLIANGRDPGVVHDAIRGRSVPGSWVR